MKVEKPKYFTLANDPIKIIDWGSYVFRLCTSIYVYVCVLVCVFVRVIHLIYIWTGDNLTNCFASHQKNKHLLIMLHLFHNICYITD